jgi:hypothetical protein
MGTAYIDDTPHKNDNFLSRRQVCEMLDTTIKQSFYNEPKGQFPKPDFVVGVTGCWLQTTVEKWRDENTVTVNRRVMKGTPRRFQVVVTDGDIEPRWTGSREVVEGLLK